MKLIIAGIFALVVSVCAILTVIGILTDNRKLAFSGLGVSGALVLTALLALVIFAPALGIGSIS